MLSIVHRSGCTPKVLSIDGVDAHRVMPTNWEPKNGDFAMSGVLAV
jgi:hypothetical protein